MYYVTKSWLFQYVGNLEAVYSGLVKWGALESHCLNSDCASATLWHVSLRDLLISSEFQFPHLKNVDDNGTLT